MKKRTKVGIREMMILSTLVASQAHALETIRTEFSPDEVSKMDELEMNPLEFKFFKGYLALVRQYLELKGKFGIARLHDHFDLERDEVLLETSDEQSRTSVTRVVPRASLSAAAVPAIISDGEGHLGNVQVQSWCCDD